MNTNFIHSLHTSCLKPHNIRIDFLKVCGSTLSPSWLYDFPSETLREFGFDISGNHIIWCERPCAFLAGYPHSLFPLSLFGSKKTVWIKSRPRAPPNFAFCVHKSCHWPCRRTPRTRGSRFKPKSRGWESRRLQTTALGGVKEPVWWETIPCCVCWFLFWVDPDARRSLLTAEPRTCRGPSRAIGPDRGAGDNADSHTLHTWASLIYDGATTSSDFYASPALKKQQQQQQNNCHSMKHHRWHCCECGL